MLILTKPKSNVQHGKNGDRSYKMRIATLQFDPALEDVKGNIKKADMLLFRHKDRLENLDLLVLPELAFAGKLKYFRNF